MLGFRSREPLTAVIPLNASLGLVSVPVLLAVHTSPGLIVHESVAPCPCTTELGETLIKGACGAFTVRVATTAFVGSGHVRV